MFFKRKKKQSNHRQKQTAEDESFTKTKATIDFFNGKKSADDLLETDKAPQDHSGKRRMMKNS